MIKVAIVEDQRDIREGLASLIKYTDGYQCTGSYRSMEEALEKIRSELPEIMLVDIGLPGMNGIEGIRLLKENYPQLLLLMLTVYDDDEMIFDALCAGACGYLLKKTPPALLIAARPAVPSSRLPVRMTPTTRDPYERAADRKSGSTAGRSPRPPSLGR